MNCHRFKHGLSLMLVSLLAAGCAKPAEPIPKGKYDEAIETLAQKLEKYYFTPAVGAQYAARLRENVQQGAYSGIDDSSAVAERLSEDLQSVSRDLHLRVMVEQRQGETGDAGAPPPRPKPIGEMKWARDGVAYIFFREFSSDPDTLREVSSFMKDYVTAKTVIIDARGLPGGSSEVFDVMLPYLYSRETVLVEMDTNANVIKERGKPPPNPTMREVSAPTGLYRREHFVTPDTTETRLFGANVLYLISARTASAGEHLALALKRTHRAVLIGEQTAGANHFGGEESLGSGLTVFLPIGRTFDPDTGEDWEGVGIAPDVAVSADTALDEALRRAQ